MDSVLNALLEQDGLESHVAKHANPAIFMMTIFNVVSTPDINASKTNIGTVLCVFVSKIIIG